MLSPKNQFGGIIHQSCRLINRLPEAGRVVTLRRMKTRMLSGLILVMTGAAPALAATLPARAPGLWQSTSTVTGPDGKPLANATNVVTVSCVDPATDLKFFLSGASACSSLNIAGSGGSYTIDGACTLRGKADSIHMALVYADPKNVTLTAGWTGVAGQMTLTSQLQWQGDCMDGMVPGDEGSIAGGAFSKADNINDPDNQ
jgi:hypothetical protein